jgi:hypothetical protein
MNNPYPIPGTGAPPANVGFTGPYFSVGNNCCNGGMSNDISARTMVMFDYSGELSTGVNVTSVSYVVTPPDVTPLVVSNETLSANISTFIVSGGTAGSQYSIEAIAQLSNGEIWIDHITVNVVECAPYVYTGPGLLYGPSPVIISSTLYYIALAQQTVFPLDTPDEFGRTGTAAGSGVVVYVNGSRLVPINDYMVDLANNQIILVWPAGVGNSVIIDLTAPPVMVTNPMPNILSSSFYYSATAGQTTFPLSVADLMGNTTILTTPDVGVFRNGARQIANTYTVDLVHNQIVLNRPAGVGESIIFDLIDPTSGEIGSGAATVHMEPLTVSAGNVLSNLSFVADGGLMILFVNGAPMFPIGSQAAFSVNGQVITWTSTSYAVPVGAVVIAVYTHAI